MRQLKLAIIGCGAVTELFHLPASKLVNTIEVVGLADVAEARAKQLAERFAIPRVTNNYREVENFAEAALVALPNALHLPVTIDLLNRGMHVLVEKPMALTACECDAMISAATSSNTKLSIGLVRRFYDSSKYVKQVVDAGVLGKILKFDFREGGIFKWSGASPSMYKKEVVGGGALMDIGVHVLDLLLWWLGDYEMVEYYDDAEGGIEANCELHFRMRTGVNGVVELSRTRDLRNTYIICGEKGSVELESEFDPLIHLYLRDEAVRLSGRVHDRDNSKRVIANGWSVLRAFAAQFDDFASSVIEHREPFIPGKEGRRAIDLIENCYAAKRPLSSLYHYV
jgi:predicted dehydrogenase